MIEKLVEELGEEYFMKYIENEPIIYKIGWSEEDVFDETNYKRNLKKMSKKLKKPETKINIRFDDNSLDDKKLIIKKIKRVKLLANRVIKKYHKNNNNKLIYLSMIDIFIKNGKILAEGTLSDYWDLDIFLNKMLKIKNKQ